MEVIFRPDTPSKDKLTFSNTGHERLRENVFGCKGRAQAKDSS